VSDAGKVRGSPLMSNSITTSIRQDYSVELRILP
jgi:hypothetical protein